MKTSKLAAVALSSMTLAGVTAIAAGVAAPASASTVTIAPHPIGHDDDGDRVKNDNDLDNRNDGRNDGRNKVRNNNWQRQEAEANNRNWIVQKNRQKNRQKNENRNRNENKKQRHHHRHHSPMAEEE